MSNQKKIVLYVFEVDPSIMNKDKIKVGTIIWWKRIGNSSGQHINCPGIISEVSEYCFRVFTFDSMEESEDIPFNSPSRSEMRVISKERIQKWYAWKMQAHTQEIERLALDLKSAKSTFAEYQSKAKESWEQYGLNEIFGDFVEK